MLADMADGDTATRKFVKGPTVKAVVNYVLVSTFANNCLYHNFSIREVQSCRCFDAVVWLDITRSSGSSRFDWK